MTVATRAFLTAILLMSMVTGLYGGETGSQVADYPAWGAQHWTKYDWNASAGKGGNARFDIEDGKHGGLLHISAAMPDDARFVRELKVEPYTVYRFACQVRTENVASSARGAGISFSRGYCVVTAGLSIVRNVTPRPLTTPNISGIRRPP